MMMMAVTIQNGIIIKNNLPQYALENVIISIPITIKTAQAVN